MIPVYFAQIKATVDQYAATRFVLDATTSFDTRPGDQGYLTGSVIFEDFSVLHFREFVDATQGTIAKLTYSYHYQNADTSLIFRYDNARHKPPLPFREHKHAAAEPITAAPAPTLVDVLSEIFQLQGWV